MAIATQKENLLNTAGTLKAIAHPERLAILDLLCQAPKGKLTVKAIYKDFRLPQPVVSRHLAIFKSSGVVQRLQQGQKVFYSLCLKKKNIESLLGCFPE